MSLVSSNTRAKRAHTGPRNIHAICVLHAEENGPRPSLVGLKGDAKKSALSACSQWDAKLLARSTVLAQGVNNGVARISAEGFVVPVQR